MGFGGQQSAPLPEPEPIPQTPQDDDPDGIFEAQRVIRANKEREGAQGHLLSGGHQGDTSDPGTTRKTLQPQGDLLG